MTDEYICVIGADGEIYEVRPTEALLSFLQRLAEAETEELERKEKEGILAMIDR